jgi:transaldolase
MLFFVDTGSIEEIRQAKRLGILAGVTTNPSLLAKEKGNRSFRDTIREICEIVQGPVSAEVVSDNAEEMIREGREIMTWHEHVVIKVPIGAEGLVAISTLSSEGARINTTLIFNANQALLAAPLSAAWTISPRMACSSFVTAPPSSAPTASPPRCWRPACGIRGTSPRRRWPAPTWPPSPTRCSCRA